MLLLCAAILDTRYSILDPRCFLSLLANTKTKAKLSSNTLPPRPPHARTSRRARDFLLGVFSQSVLSELPKLPLSAPTVSLSILAADPSISPPAHRNTARKKLITSHHCCSHNLPPARFGSPAQDTSVPCKHPGCKSSRHPSNPRRERECRRSCGFCPAKHSAGSPFLLPRPRGIALCPPPFHADCPQPPADRTTGPLHATVLSYIQDLSSAVSPALSGSDPDPVSGPPAVAESSTVSHLHLPAHTYRSPIPPPSQSSSLHPNSVQPAPPLTPVRPRRSGRIHKVPCCAFQSQPHLGQTHPRAEGRLQMHR